MIWIGVISNKNKDIPLNCMTIPMRHSALFSRETLENTNHRRGAHHWTR